MNLGGEAIPPLVRSHATSRCRSAHQETGIASPNLSFYGACVKTRSTISRSFPTSCPARVIVSVNTRPQPMSERMKRKPCFPTKANSYKDLEWKRLCNQAH